jgi:hypothetical protein
LLSSRDTDTTLLRALFQVLSGTLLLGAAAALCHNAEYVARLLLVVGCVSQLDADAFPALFRAIFKFNWEQPAATVETYVNVRLFFFFVGFETTIFFLQM